MSLEYQCTCGACEGSLAAIRRHEDAVIRASQAVTPTDEKLEKLMDDLRTEAYSDGFASFNSNPPSASVAAAMVALREYVSARDKEIGKLTEIAQDNHDSYAMLRDRADTRPSPADIASAVVQRVVELDYTPPEDFNDDMVMLTTGELSTIVKEEAARRASMKEHPE